MNTKPIFLFTMMGCLFLSSCMILQKDKKEIEKILDDSVQEVVEDLAKV